MSKELPENLTVSSLSDFKSKSQSGELVQLPSGLVARLRKPSLSRMLREGKIPMELAQSVMGMQNQPTGKMDLEKLKENLGVVDIWVAEAFIEPKVALEGELTVSDLSDEDYEFVSRYVQGEAQKLNSFRTEADK